MSASAGQLQGLRGVVARVASRLPFLVDAYRFVRNPAWERAMRRDLASTRSTSAFLREVPPGSGPSALVALYRDDLYETKVALVLASALRLQGVPVVVSIPSGRAHRVRRYASAFGIDRVIAQDQLELTASE